jgi:hypothetical protein
MNEFYINLLFLSLRLTNNKLRRKTRLIIIDNKESQVYLILDKFVFLRYVLDQIRVWFLHQ